MWSITLSVQVGSLLFAFSKVFSMCMRIAALWAGTPARLSVSTDSTSEQNFLIVSSCQQICVSIRVSVFQLPFLCVCVCIGMCKFLSCVCVCLYVRWSARVWWQHILTSHYALAQKVLPDHANTTAPGARSGERRWVGGKGMCVHYAYEPPPRFPTTPRAKKFQLGGCSRYVHEPVNLYHVCHSEKIKALVYSGALLPPLISISKRRRGHGRELSRLSRPEQKGPDRTRGIIAGMWLHSTGSRRQWRQSTYRSAGGGGAENGHVSAFLIKGWAGRAMGMEKSIRVNVLVRLHVCKNFTSVNTKKAVSFTSINPTCLRHRGSPETNSSFNLFMGITYEQSHCVY